SEFWASASTLLMTVVSSVLGVSAFFSGSALTSGVALAAEADIADVAADFAGAEFARMGEAEGWLVFLVAEAALAAEVVVSACRERAGSDCTRLIDPVNSATEIPPSSKLRRRRRRGASVPSVPCSEAPRRSRSFELRASSSATVNCLSSAIFLIQSLVSPAQNYAFSQCPRADLELFQAQCTHRSFSYECTSHDLVRPVGTHTFKIGTVCRSHTRNKVYQLTQTSSRQSSLYERTSR